MIDEWELVVDGARKLVAFLQQERIPDGNRLPSDVVLPPLAALWAQAPEKPDQVGAVRTLLRSYMWRAFATARYEFAAATASYQDYRAILPVAKNGGGATPPTDIFSLPLPGPDELRMAGWPKRRDRLARAILATSFRGGARDIADGAEISASNAEDQEYHHLFPVAYLKQSGIDEAAASVALNCALITWLTNRVISAKPPVEYLRDRTKAAALGEEQVRERLASHGISYDDLAGCDFETFLSRRAEVVADAFNVLARGGQWP